MDTNGLFSSDMKVQKKVLKSIASILLRNTWDKSAQQGSLMALKYLPGMHSIFLLIILGWSISNINCMDFTSALCCQNICESSWFYLWVLLMK